MDGITVYTDGSCMGNGSGKSGCGWACKLIYRGHEKIKSGSDTGKTNNQMEMIAVLNAMKSITDTSIPVTVYSDSRYVVETLNGNYKIKKNEKLWASIMKERKRFDDIKFQWVKGHGGNKHNNDVDRRAAREASRRIKKHLGGNGMTLNEFMETAINSDRLLVQDSGGNELYRGFIGCLQYQGIDGERNVENADEVVRGGSGYCIGLKGGREVYNAEKDGKLPPEIEHIYPDYSLYPELTKDTAYGFMSRGCPRGCGFCHVGAKEGRNAEKVADLSEFWNGQGHIKLMDPNTAASREWRDIFGQLAESGAWVDFTQGLDIRLMTQEKIAELMKIKIEQVHFAWDNYEDKEIIVPKLKEFAETTGWGRKKMSVYVLANFNTTLEQDLDRIYTLRDMGYMPYVMIYDKQNVRRGSSLRRLQRWVNSKTAFYACRKFEDFK